MIVRCHPVKVIVLLALALVSLPAYGADQAAGELSSLVAAALANNPEVASSQARWEMFANRVMQAGRLEDPMLMLKIQNGIVTDPFNFRKDPMTQKVIGISQQVPFFGKRQLRAEVAAREAESHHWLVEERSWRWPGW